MLRKMSYLVNKLGKIGTLFEEASSPFTVIIWKNEVYTEYNEYAVLILFLNYHHLKIP